MARQTEAAEAQIRTYKEIFNGGFFLEIQENGITYNEGEDDEISQHDINLELIKLGKKTDTTVLATNDCHYLRAEDAEIHDIILAVQTNAKLSDPDRFKFDSTSLYVKSEEEMRDSFSYYLESVDNSGWLANSIGTVEIDLGGIDDMHFPNFKIEEADDYEQFISRNS